MKYHVEVAGRTVVVDLDADGVSVDGSPVDVDLDRVPGTRVHSLVVDGRSHRFLADRGESGEWTLHLAGRPVTAEVVDERTRAIREMTGAGQAAAGSTVLRAPMPGLVVAVEVEEGQEVEEGDGLLVVEAMKMENELRAEGPGRIGKIHVSAGDAVEMNDVLVEFEAGDADPSEAGGEE